MFWTDVFAPFPTTQFERAAFLPAADIAVNGGDMVLTMDLPGLTAEDLSLEAVNGQLIIRGERRRPELAEGSRWAFAERTFGAFERRVQLPRGVDPDAVTASMDNGVLSLIVPKPEAMKPKAIRIGQGSQQRELETAAA